MNDPLVGINAGLCEQLASSNNEIAALRKQMSSLSSGNVEMRRSLLLFRGRKRGLGVRNHGNFGLVAVFSWENNTNS